MTTLPPNRDAVERVIAQGERDLAAYKPAKHVAEVFDRRLSLEVVSVLLRAQADARDQGVIHALFLGVLAHALGNALASVVLSASGGDEAAAARALDLVVRNVEAYALKVLEGPGDIEIRGKPTPMGRA